MYDLGARRQRVPGEGFSERRCKLVGLRLQFVDDLGQNLVDRAATIVALFGVENFQFGHVSLLADSTRQYVILVPYSCPRLCRACEWAGSCGALFCEQIAARRDL